MTTTAQTARTDVARSIVMTEPITGRAATSTARAAGYAGAAILLFAFVFHAYWGIGGTWGAAVAYGSPEIPPPAASAVVAILIACAAALLLTRIGLATLPLPRWMLRASTWVFVAVFALAGVTNLIQDPDAYARAWHIYFFGPLMMTLAALCAIVARSRDA